VKIRPELLLLAVLLVPDGNLRGATESVVFDAGFTNRTEWTVSSNFLYSTENKAWYFTARNSPLVSPLYPFAITSVTAIANLASTNTTRDLFAIPLVNGIATTHTSLWRDITPTPEKGEVRCGWDRANGVHAFVFCSLSGKGNVYLHAAVIRGSLDGLCARLR
jgi:hypothetical protein